MVVLTACSLTARRGWREHEGRKERTQCNGEREKRKARPYYSRARIMANVITHTHKVQYFNNTKKL
jgi:hypothetical protein